MKFPYTYVVVDSSPAGAILRYSSPGLPDQTIGIHTPRQGESPDDIAEMYAPHAIWADLDVVRVPMTVGATGSYTPLAPPIAPVDPRTPLRQAQDRKLAELAAWRYAQEVGGVNFGGARILTDRESQATITSAYISLSQGLATSIDFKAEGGQWITLGIAQIEPIAQAVVAHVQACFTAEKQLADQVEACTTVEAVDALAFPEGFL